MVASRLIVLAAALGASASFTEERHLSLLLKRQAPGTPAYNCHDNCGQAILFVRAGGDVCSNDGFLADYKNCLKCAGPDNTDIWQYYGTSLTSAASGCGLSTTPLSGTQPSVGDAIPAAGSSSSAAASSIPAPSSAVPVSSAAPSSEVPAETTGEAPASAPAASTPAASTPIASESPVETPAYSGTVAVVTPTVTGTGGVAPTGNGTATYTTSAPPEQQTTNAGANLGFSNAGMIGAIAIGMVYGFGN